MTAEERIELLVKAMEGMTQREWWSVVESVEVVFEEAKVKLALTNREVLKS